MNDSTQTIILALLTSNGFFAFVQYLLTRRDTKKRLEERFETLKEELKGKLRKQEKDSLRTQLLLLILLKPEEEQEILTIGEHYFKELEGNWYMTSIFNRWLDDKGVAKPEWFKGL